VRKQGFKLRSIVSKSSPATGVPLVPFAPVRPCNEVDAGMTSIVGEVSMGQLSSHSCQQIGVPAALHFDYHFHIRGGVTGCDNMNIRVLTWNGRVTSLKEERNAIIQKCLKGVIPDAMVKEWLDKTSLEEQALKCQLALVAESALDTPEVLKRGLGVLADLGSVWEKSNLTTRQQLQGFIFPEGVTARKEGFGTDPIALCLRAEELPSPVITSVVGPPGFEPRTKWL